MAVEPNEVTVEEMRDLRIERWRGTTLPVNRIAWSGAEHDVYNNAQRVADNTGTPQRIVVVRHVDGDDFDQELDVVEPNLERCAAAGGLDRMPRLIRKVLGW